MDQPNRTYRQPFDARHHAMPWEARPIPGMGLVALVRSDDMYPHASVHVPGDRREPIDHPTLATALFVERACNAFYIMQAALAAVPEAAAPGGPAARLPEETLAVLRGALAAAERAMPTAIAAALANPAPIGAERAGAVPRR